MARAAGRPRLRQAERDQVAWRAVSLDALLPADHRTRLVRAFVERLDLSSLHAAIRAVEGHAGHPPADPRILMALWLQAMSCTRFLWTPICPRRDRNDDVQHEEDRSSFSR